MFRELPIFPLPLVLFPGATQPLHIFEPRYRDMVRDAAASHEIISGRIPWKRTNKGSS